WSNCTGAQFTALRYLALDGTTYAASSTSTSSAPWPPTRRSRDTCVIAAQAASSPSPRTLGPGIRESAFTHPLAPACRLPAGGTTTGAGDPGSGAFQDCFQPRKILLVDTPDRARHHRSRQLGEASRLTPIT